VEAQLHTIDIHFIAGPKRANASFGIFELDGDNFRICLGLTGVKRPAAFATRPVPATRWSSCCAASKARPAAVSQNNQPALRNPHLMRATSPVLNTIPAPPMKNYKGNWRAN